MKVNFFAPVNNLGYGIHAYNTMLAFEKLGHEVVLIAPFGVIAEGFPRTIEWLAGRSNVNAKDPGVMIFCDQYLMQFAGRPRVGFPVFEMDVFTPVQKAMMKSCDFLLTPTRWGLQTMIENGIDRDRIRVVHEGFDPGIFTFRNKSEADLAERPFTFINVGKFELRKGTIQAIECFFRALEGESAALILHVSNPFIKDYSEMEKTLLNIGFKASSDNMDWRRAGLTIHFSNTVTRHEEIAALYARADCGLFPTRAEGWGLPILESLATGMPCITGRWTGMSEYIPNYYPEELILKNPMKQTAYDGLWFLGDVGTWNVPTDGELINAIRWAFKNVRALRVTEIWRSQVEDIRYFTWNSAAKMLENAMVEFCQKAESDNGK